jgi:hypothetical protein
MREFIIRINDLNPLGEVTKELGRLGYQYDENPEDAGIIIEHVHAFEDGVYALYNFPAVPELITSLSEIKKLPW